MYQAKKLAEAKRKLAKMQVEVEQLQKACGDSQPQIPHHVQEEASHQAETQNRRQASLSHQAKPTPSSLPSKLTLRSNLSTFSSAAVSSLASLLV